MDVYLFGLMDIYLFISLRGQYTESGACARKKRVRVRAVFL